MRKYALITLITLNMSEYAGIYLKRQSSEFIRSQNSGCVWCGIYKAEGHCTNYWAVIETETYQNTVKHLKWSVFPKKKRGVGEVSETRALRQNILSKTQKKRPRENFLDSLKTTFWMENLFQTWAQSVPFFPKPVHFFDFQKRQWVPLLSPQAERLWVWLNLHHYSWICLNIFENAWIYCFVGARALNMHDHDHLTCAIGFCRCLGF